MKPTKIAFTKKYFPEQYHGEDYFIEYLLEEGDTLCACFKKAKQDTFQCFKENNPQIQWNDEVIQVNKERVVKTDTDTTTYNPDGSVTSILNKSIKLNGEINPEKINKGTIEEQIQDCTNVTDLNSFKLYTDLNKKYKPIFDEKFKELEQQKNV